MITRSVLCLAAMALMASAANAQVADSSSRSGFLFGPMVGPSSGWAKGSVGATIEYIHKLEAEARARQSAPAGQKECPMPVHRADTTQLEKMRVVRPSPTIVYSMPTPDPHCPNPLDHAK
jgi:hypothetical protein